MKEQEGRGGKEGDVVMEPMVVEIMPDALRVMQGLRLCRTVRQRAEVPTWEVREGVLSKTMSRPLNARRGQSLFEKD